MKQKKLITGLALAILFILPNSVVYAQLGGLVRSAMQKTGAVGDLFEDKTITTSIADALPVSFWLQDLEEYRVPVEAYDYNFMLESGYYKFTLQSYCLQAGTYGPSKGDGYLLAPVRGKQAGVVKNVLKNSANHPNIKQQDIQRLLWGIIAGTKFTDYDAAFQSRVRPLLSTADIASLSVDVKKILSTLIDAAPDDVKKSIKFYSDFRSKLTNPNTSYNELVSMAMLNGVLPDDAFSKHIQKGLWAHIGNGFYAKALPNGYTETVYCVYKPGRANAVYDSQNRLTRLSKNCYSVEITYDDASGRNVISFGSRGNYPIWRMKSLRFKNAKSGQEYTLENTGWIIRGDGKKISGGSASSRTDDPSFEEYNNRINKANVALQNMNSYKARLDNAQSQRLLDAYAQLDGLYQAGSLLFSNSQLQWIKNVIAVSADHRNNECSALAGEESIATGKQKVDIISNLAAPATNGKQRLAMSERPSRPVQRPSMSAEEICVDNSNGNIVDTKPTVKKGKLIFLTHGLNDNGTCFEQTVKSLNEYDDYYDFGLVEVHSLSSINWAQDINERTDKGLNVLVRLEFSAGNLSFADQLQQMTDMVARFYGHNADVVVFVGHSMGGLASINYGMKYANENTNKKVKIITVSTPYHPNNYAREVWLDITTISAFFAEQKRGEAHRDLGSFPLVIGEVVSALDNLKINWGKFIKSNNQVALYAIAVSMYGKKGEQPSDDMIGDGIVDIPSQQGKGWANIETQSIPIICGNQNNPIIHGKGKERSFLPLNDFNPYHHINTPDRDEVIGQIKEIIERTDDNIKVNTIKNATTSPKWSF